MENKNVSDLYERAKLQIWNVDTDISWSAAARAGSPVLEESVPLRGFLPYEQLSVGERADVLWRRHILQLSDILCGEQGALLLSAQLLSCMPDMESALFASSQVSDEARHVEFFRRYITAVGAEPAPGQAWQQLVATALQESRWEMKMIICQVLIESLALTRFQELRANSADPLLRNALGLILRDEARHVNFGQQMLAAHLASLPVDELDQFAEAIVERVLTLSDMDAELRLGAALGWDGPALRHHLRRWNLQHPESGRRRLRLLARNLEGVGLWRGRARERLEPHC